MEEGLWVTQSCRISLPVAFFAQGEMEGWLLVNGTTELQQLVTVWFRRCGACSKLLRFLSRFTVCATNLFFFEGVTSKNCMAKSSRKKPWKAVWKATAWEENSHKNHNLTLFITFYVNLEISISRSKKTKKNSWTSFVTWTVFPKLRQQLCSSTNSSMTQPFNGRPTTKVWFWCRRCRPLNFDAV